MTFDEIRRMPTVVEAIPEGARGVHESVLRSYRILAKVEELIRGDPAHGIACPAGLLLDLIAMMRTDLPTKREGDAQ
jgi:hypothetical protein